MLYVGLIVSAENSAKKQEVMINLKAQPRWVPPSSTADKKPIGFPPINTPPFRILFVFADFILGGGLPVIFCFYSASVIILQASHLRNWS